LGKLGVISRQAGAAVKSAVKVERSTSLEWAARKVRVFIAVA
jgi:hypothetical protein